MISIKFLQLAHDKHKDAGDGGGDRNSFISEHHGDSVRFQHSVVFIIRVIHDVDSLDELLTSIYIYIYIVFHSMFVITLFKKKHEQQQQKNVETSADAFICCCRLFNITRIRCRLICWAMLTRRLKSDQPLYCQKIIILATIMQNRSGSVVRSFLIS